VVCINICFICHTVKQNKKRKKEKRGVFPECPRHSGKAIFFFKKGRAFPECLGIRHSGKGKLKKDMIFPECQVHRHSGKRFKKTNFFPE
jgi:hypothetical protein